jgi:hypothetical protein
MKRFTVLLFYVVFTAGCTVANSYPPDFKAGSTLINDLQKTYQCTAIEFENWDEDDLTDSTLTIGLINSEAFVQMSDKIQTKQLNLVGTAVKNSLKYPERYKVYYVIFMRRSGKFLFEGTAHTYGAELPANQL